MTSPSSPPATPAEVQQVARETIRFAMATFRELAKGGDNLVFSPYGLREVLSLASAGATGSTLTDFRKTLAMDLPEERTLRAFGSLGQQLTTLPGWPKAKTHSTFRVANGLWTDREFPTEARFRRLAQETPGSTFGTLALTGAPAESLRAINAWASRETEGRIPRILEGLPDHARCVLANAVTFKGAWAEPFHEQNTRMEPFTLLSGVRKEARLMDGGGMLDYAEVEGCQALAMDFLEGPFRMVFLLPPLKTFRAFEAGLDGDRLARIREGLRQGHLVYAVSVTLPRFQVDATPPIQEALLSLGLAQAFSDGATFGRLSPRPLRLDQVVQKAMIAVDEGGAEAAAVTTAIVVDMAEEPAPQPKRAVFRADHPFVFLLLDRESGVVLFMGHYLHP